MVVCGIDPGLERTGYAVVRDERRRRHVVDAGIITSRPRQELARRLVEIGEGVRQVFSEHRPTVVAVEELFTHYRHPRTAVLMAHARGVILQAAAELGIAVRHFSATQVKKSLTGNGRAGKQQVQRAIAVTLGLAAPPEPADVADALAVALCALTRREQVGT